MLHFAIILDADMPVEDALTLLQSHASESRVVIRRQVDLQLFFYAFRAGDLLLLATRAADPRMSIAAALALREEDATTTSQFGDVAKASDAFSPRVVLDGTTVLGVFEPPFAVATTAAAQPPAAAPPPPAAAAPEAAGATPTILRPAAAERAVPTMAPPRSPFPNILSRIRAPRRMRGASAELAMEPPREAAIAEPTHFKAHPSLELEKDVVEPGERFDLTIALAQEAQAHTSGTAITATLPAGTTTFDLDVQLVADGFESPSGWFFRMRVPIADPESAQLTVSLRAPSDDIVRLSLLEVHFSHGGVPCGVAFRKIAVKPRDSASVPSAVRGTAFLSTAPAAEMSIDPADPAPDLWITISKPDDNQASGRYYWSFKSPHNVSLPQGPIAIDLGADARTFADRMLKGITRAERTSLIDQQLDSIGRQIREKAPEVLEDVLQEVWRAVHPVTLRVPTVLLHSAEPHVPWELARLADPPDASRPAFFGAQFSIGRWILGPRNVRLPPAREVVVRSMAVIAGDYRSSRNLRPLPKAIEEGSELEKRWGATRLTATVDQMNELLEARLQRDGATIGGAEAIHFACHGEVDPRNQNAMIFLDNDWPLDPSLFLEAPIGRTHEPFMFLNACQVGQAGELLGDYAGFAGFCLRNRFRGFVAPLWSVSDDIAHTIALQFYDAAFHATEPRAVADILRDIRGQYCADGAAPASTWLAYVFYGNPSLILRHA